MPFYLQSDTSGHPETRAATLPPAAKRNRAVSRAAIRVKATTAAVAAAARRRSGARRDEAEVGSPPEGSGSGSGGGKMGQWT